MKRVFAVRTKCMQVSPKEQVSEYEYNFATEAERDKYFEAAVSLAVDRPDTKITTRIEVKTKRFAIVQSRVNTKYEQGYESYDVLEKIEYSTEEEVEFIKIDI